MPNVERTLGFARLTPTYAYDEKSPAVRRGSNAALKKGFSAGLCIADAAFVRHKAR